MWGEKLVPMALFFMFLCGQGLILITQASAGCCMCGSCKVYCTCPGQGACNWCAAPNSAEDPMVSEKIKFDRESSLGATETITNRFAASVRGIGGKFDLKVLDFGVKGLKFGCPESDDKAILHGNITFALLADTRQ